MRRALKIAILALCLQSAPAAATVEVPVASCPSGTFALTASRSTVRGAAAAEDGVVLRDGTVEIPGRCPAVAARIRATAGGTVVRAKWRRCGSAGPTLLRARILPGCGEMVGTLITARPFSWRRFSASPSSCDSPAACTAGCIRDDECGAGEYCAKRSGNCAGRGTCKARQPLACLALWDPVCSCDGDTYSSACHATSAGANVSYSGQCARSCDVATPCPSAQFCDMRPGVCASALDAGVCVDVPTACTHLYDPVCGCDGVTHPNDCQRRASRVQKAHHGACSVP